MSCRVLRALPVVVCLVACALADVAIAASPCPLPFTHPAKASRFRSSLVQAFVPCDSELGGSAPNATTETGTVPSCYPAATWHEQAGSPSFGWTWGPRSHGAVELKTGTNALVGPEYPLNDDPEAVDLYVRARLADVRSHEGLADGLGTLGIGLRITLIDRENAS